MNWILFFIILIIVAIIIINLFPKSKPQRHYTKNELMVKAMKEILERPGQERQAWFHDLLESLPKYTFPIEGICKDGELVETVLERLKKEGNPEKLAYFKSYMEL